MQLLQPERLPTASARYLGWLADNGYPLSEVEALAGPGKKGRRK